MALDPWLLFGGSFDPPHQGHLALAQAASRHYQVEKVIFVLNRTNPFKKKETTQESHRLAMLKLLVEPQHEVVTWELEREGPSYTIETLRYAKSLTTKTLIWLVGADCLKDLHRWKEISEIFKLATIQLVSRENADLTIPDELVGKIGSRLALSLVENLIVMSPAAFSSTQIRHALCHRQKPLGLPSGLLKYIDQHKLYRDLKND